jgi:hypothetical protein
MQVRHRRDDARLAATLDEVNAARATLLMKRSRSITAVDWQDHAARCAKLADAVQTFSDAAAASGVPLPYQFRDELRLYRALAERPDHRQRLAL